MIFIDQREPLGQNIRNLHLRLHPRQFGVFTKPVGTVEFLGIKISLCFNLGYYLSALINLFTNRLKNCDKTD